MEDTDAAADLLEAALFGGEELLDQATVDLSVELPLIDGYKLLRLLGEGGFGMVYEAEQRVPIRRRVALKVLRPGCTTREMLARFEQERQMLALLNHPHIARIFDAGETDDGRPFIAMELVKGSTIDRHAQRLPLSEKVSLMRDVSRAVGYAHRKGVIHRDLKPSNILITHADDGSPEPRVIDFGIAKALDGPLSAKVMFTQIRQVVGTPGYMSPERQHTSQISHSADTRTDVFALGAILWELLTGKTPEQAVDGGETRIKLPEARRIPAELRWITEKATDPDMERRYANADALADDLERYLGGHPLAAGPRGTLYVLGKLAQRHRVAAVALLITTTTLVVSLLVVSSALVTSNRDRSEMRRASAAADYFLGISRARLRPVHAMAQWCRAVRQDPQNRAASGVLLATLGHRHFPHPIAPAVMLPDGEVSHVALSENANWVGVILTGAEGEFLVRARRDSTEVTQHAIPADGRMRHLAVANDGCVAVAGGTGPVGLLQPNGEWRASKRELEALRGIAWNAAGHLWMIGHQQLARCDTLGLEETSVIDLPDRLLRWHSSRNGDHLVLGISGGRIQRYDTSGSLAETLQAPIPAPFASLAIDESGQKIAAAWRNGEVWVRGPEGKVGSCRVGNPLHLEFMTSVPQLLITEPTNLAQWSFEEENQVRNHALDAPLKQLLPLHGEAVLLKPVYGDPLILHAEADPDSMAVPGVTGRVDFAAGQGGRVIALIDAENHVLEWLGLGSSTRSTTTAPCERIWLCMRPSLRREHWIGIDRDGWVCDVTADGSTTPRWRVHEGPLRLAAVDASGDVALIDLVESPHVMLATRGGPAQIQAWGKPSGISLSPDGHHAMLGFPAGHVSLYDTRTGVQVHTRDWNRGPVTAVTFLDAKRVALAVASQLRVWDWTTDTALPAPIDYPGHLHAVAGDHTGTRLAAAGAGVSYVIDVETGLRIVTQAGAPEDLTAIVWEEDDKRLWFFSATPGATGRNMPPMLSSAPEWLPDYVESRIGMKVNELDRVVRLRATDTIKLPSDVPEDLRSWLE